MDDVLRPFEFRFARLRRCAQRRQVGFEQRPLPGTGLHEQVVDMGFNAAAHTRQAVMSAPDFRGVEFGPVVLHLNMQLAAPHLQTDINRDDLGVFDIQRVSVRHLIDRHQQQGGHHSATEAPVHSQKTFKPWNQRGRRQTAAELLALPNSMRPQFSNALVYRQITPQVHPL